MLRHPFGVPQIPLVSNSSHIVRHHQTSTPETPETAEAPEAPEALNHPP